jgi:succinoglycan biosynthesis protein ExoM
MQPADHVEMVAVCICTDGKRATLRDCLRSIIAQEPPPAARMRVVLVDNSGRAGGSPLAEGLDVVEVAEPRRGIPAARNKALDTALALGADWIAFLDDDEFAPPQWLGRLLAIGRASACDVLQGGVAYADSWEETVHTARDWQPPRELGAARKRAAAATNNVIFKRWLVGEPGRLRFDESMTSGGSDGEFFMRAHRLGATIMRTGDALVVEHRPPERLSLQHATRRSFRVGANCNFRYRKNYPAPAAFVRLLLRAGERLVGGVARLVAAAPLALVSTGRARDLLRRAWADICFAGGCLGPYFGLAPDRYH